MTTQTITSINEFSPPTQPSSCEIVDISHLVRLPSSLKDANCRILMVTTPQARPKKPPKIGHRLSDVIHELESTERGATEMNEARRWVAETLYSGEEISLHALRMRLGLSQIDLARKLHTTQARISIYERGAEQPAFEMMKRMSEALGVDMNTLGLAIERAATRNLRHVKIST